MRKSTGGLLGSRSSKVSFYLLFAVFCLLGNVYAEFTRVDLLGSIPKRNGRPSTDTIQGLDILRKFEWKVRITDQAGNIKELITTRPDSITISKPAVLTMTTDFIVNKALCNKVVGLDISIRGSLKVDLNGVEIVKTGEFETRKKGKFKSLSCDNFVPFVFADTLQHIAVTYKVHPSMLYNSMSLEFSEINRLENTAKSNEISTRKSFAFAFYYLAIGIIFFILFLFHRERNENFYFALFCFFGALGFLSPYMEVAQISHLSNFFVILALEFLSFFFVKVFRGKERNRIPLFVILFIVAASFVPALRYNYSLPIHINNVRLPAYQIVLFVLYPYVGISAFYHLLRGFSQKRWEAKALVKIIFFGLLIFWVLPFLGFAVLVSQNQNFVDLAGNWIVYSIDIGYCIYPLSAAYVLGKKNGLTQRQLVNQIQSIERLSADNLQKELEKQQILETANAELEQKVAERTNEVSSQKAELELKNKAITDNVTYAKRIQHALLPDIKLIQESVPDSFVIFLPKDIVSGDFYSFAEKNDRTILVAGDCTGHGVSGAFMSMIGSSLLNQIINERGMVQPAQVLNQLNQAVLNTFQSVDNESNDGMDVAMVSINMDIGELQFAGANRPLWLVQNDELVMIKPDKSPIGGFQMARERKFINHIIPVKKGDVFYIFTDGYADQFGGPLGKKMMTSKMRDKIMEIRDLPMAQQNKILLDYFNDWKGEMEQVDDVLLIGVRL